MESAWPWRERRSSKFCWLELAAGYPIVLFCCGCEGVKRGRAAFEGWPPWAPNVVSSWYADLGDEGADMKQINHPPPRSRHPRFSLSLSLSRPETPRCWEMFAEKDYSRFWRFVFFRWSCTRRSLFISHTVVWRAGALPRPARRGAERTRVPRARHMGGARGSTTRRSVNSLRPSRSASRAQSRHGTSRSERFLPPDQSVFWGRAGPRQGLVSTVMGHYAGQPPPLVG